ncbi:MAG: DUF4111 domain-containing protein, partial [Chloroflexota bacterium]|nr:DUF4111 domain-containing protein [Chloroflexota bacterium]
PVRRLADDFLREVRGFLGERLHGLYLFGAVAFPESAGKIADLDFHAIVREPLDETDRSAVDDLHRSLYERHRPIELDGYYILLDDARAKAPAPSQLRARGGWRRDWSWSLHREHLRAGRCVVLHGPKPADYYPPATWPELERALLREAWCARRWLPSHPAYAVLQFCRLLYSFTTRDVVVSKVSAARWARQTLAEWSRLIERAQAAYPTAGLPVGEAKPFAAYTRQRIAELRAAQTSGRLL